MLTLDYERAKTQNKNFFLKIKENDMLSKVCRPILFLFMMMFGPLFAFGETTEGFDLANKACKHHRELTYYLNIDDFVQSFIEIPTNILQDSTTVSSRYLAGRAPLYNLRNEETGICSASFLCIQNSNNIFVDIANFISLENGLIVTWFTPTTLINLELDSIVNGMVTECIVKASTKVGFNPFYGKNFNLIVSSENGRIYFKFERI